MVTPRANRPPLSDATVSNFARIDLEAKISKNIGLSFGLRKICGFGLVLGRMGLKPTVRAQFCPGHSRSFLNVARSEN